MSEKPDVVVVGAGPAGSSTALSLAKSGFSVLLVERAKVPGSKNMFGGRLYSHSIKNLIKEFPEGAKIERPVTREVLGFMSEDAVLNIDFYNTNVPEEAKSYTLSRVRFDEWFARKAEEAGAMLATGIKVDGPIVEDNAVRGILAGSDRIECDLVVACDGADSPIARKAGLLKLNYTPVDFSLGVKEVVELPKNVIEERFNLDGDEDGVAMVHIGPFTKGVMGGSFIYTNRDTLSVGTVVRLHSMRDMVTKGVDIYSHQIVNEFLSHPYISRLVKGGKLVEYSANLLPEMPWNHRPRLYGPGIIVAGDAAGFLINTGYNLRGMDLAIGSGILAAETYKRAREVGKFGARELSIYERLLEESFVMKDLKKYRRAWKVLDNPRLYSSYPDVIIKLVERLYTVDGKEKDLLLKEAIRLMKGKISLFPAILDGLRMIRAI